MAESQRDTRKLSLWARQRRLALRAWNSPLMQQSWNAKPVQRAWSSIGFFEALGLGAFVFAQFTRLPLTDGIRIEPIYFAQIYSEQKVVFPDARQWFSAVATLCLLALVCCIGVRLLFLYVPAHVMPLYLIFVLSAAVPTSLLSISEPVQDIAGVTYPQLVALVVTSSLAQLIFAAHAWRLRHLHLLRILPGIHSGLVFAALNVVALFLLYILVNVNSQTRSAINGEFWALLGAAQLLVALTSGWSEQRAAQTDADTDALLRHLPGVAATQCICGAFVQRDDFEPKTLPEDTPGMQHFADNTRRNGDPSEQRGSAARDAP